MNTVPDMTLGKTVLLAEDFVILGAMASFVVGSSVACFMAWLLRSLATDELRQGNEWRYDVSRINELRQVDVMYRLFQPAIGFLARLNRNAFQQSLPEVARQIQVAGLSRFWLPEEYLAKLQLIAFATSPVLGIMLWRVMGVSGLLFMLAGAFMVFILLRMRLARKAAHRLAEIKRRLPFLLDLLTLLMEAGSSFLQSLRQGVSEFGEHPVGTEFGRVLADMNMGKARTEAFDGLRRRLDDEEISAIVGAILQSEELGTPVSDIFRTQADVLRVKRSQRAEKIAGEAGVNMLLPAMLVMASTVILILGPFILNYMVFGLGL